MEESLNIFNSLNKLFLSFSKPEALEDTIQNITSHYSILYNKIFILESNETDELICTYNIDAGNISDGLLPNTILVHRKKESNTLYTINALNALISSLNEGKLDKNYKLDWPKYKNSILLTNQQGDLRQLDTKIYKIINL